MTPRRRDVKRKTHVPEKLDFTVHTLNGNFMTDLEGVWDVQTV